MYICIRTYMCVYIYIHRYIHIYIYIYTHTHVGGDGGCQEERRRAAVRLGRAAGRPRRRPGGTSIDNVMPPIV